MSKFSSSAAYQELLALRRQLSDAFSRNDREFVSALSSRIDRFQLELWRNGCRETAS